MEQSKSVDILCPRSTIDLGPECADWPRHLLGGVNFTQAVLLRNKIYIGTDYTEVSQSKSGKIEYQSKSVVYCSTSDLTSWNSFPVPNNVTDFGLGIYRSQLVLVGGEYKKVVKDLWVSDDGSKWCKSKSVPPMPTACRMPTVVNTGSPEYLLVIGGYAAGERNKRLDKVSVLIEKQWFSLPSLPPPYSMYTGIKYAFHNGNLYLMGSDTVLYLKGPSICCYCKMESLFDACSRVRKRKNKESVSLWKTLNMPQEFVHSPVSFGERLLVLTALVEYTQLLAYSPFTQSWVHVGDVPKSTIAAFVIPTGELVLICYGGCGCQGPEKSRNKVFKASLRESVYNPDSQFSMSALSRLEEVGIPVVTSLVEKREQFEKAALDVELPKLSFSLTGIQYLKRAVNMMLAGKGRPTTWKSLHEILEELDLKEISQQIKEHLTSVNSSLKELSTSVIMSALLQQRSLEPDQLPVKLPDYVPPTVKQDIIHSFRAMTCQLPLSPSPVQPSINVDPPSKKVL